MSLCSHYFHLTRWNHYPKLTTDELRLLLYFIVGGLHSVFESGFCVWLFGLIVYESFIHSDACSVVC